jgi:hypothetical protein
MVVQPGHRGEETAAGARGPLAVLAAAAQEIAASESVGEAARALAGAAARAARASVAVARVASPDARHLVAVGVAATPEMGAAVRAHVEVVRGALAAWDAGRAFLNFAQSATTGQRLFGEPTYHRLREVKASVDPQDVFRSNHPIPPARASRGRDAARRPAERAAATG